MADRKGHADFLQLGDWNATCSLCGFKFKASELRKHWQGQYRCQKCWEPRHPQDYVKGIPDDMSVPWSQPPADFFIPMPPGLYGGPGGPGTTGSNPPPGGGSGGTEPPAGCTVSGITGVCDFAVVDCAQVDVTSGNGGATVGCSLNGTSGVCDYSVVDCGVVDYVPAGLGG